MSYAGVMQIAKEHSDWVPIVKACYNEATRCGDYEGFAGSWALNEYQKMGGSWFPGLTRLVKYGILVKEGESSRRGTRAYYLMPDRKGVERALKKLGEI